MVEKCKSAIARAKTLDGESHGGLKGHLREILANDLFVPVLPPEVKTGTGKLVSSEGKTSPQLDIILYAPAILPPVLFDPRTGYFPAESALYVIEVKSKLTATSLQGAIQNAGATRTLDLLPTEHWTPSPEGNHPVSCKHAGTPKAVNALFAFASDLSGDVSTELERYFRYDSAAAAYPRIQVLCVVGRGYWYLGDTGWKHVQADPDIGEVMSFLAGTTNTLPQLMIAKGRPKFGNYLTTEKHDPKLVIPKPSP
jgi:hypothetical protein